MASRILLRRRRARTSSTLGSAAATAGAVIAAALFLKGPGARRRRALAADKVRHLTHTAAHELDKAERDLRQRAQGVVARTRPHRPSPAGDDLLVERARAGLGHVCSHPHAVHIEAHHGVLTLRGDILAVEHARVVKEMRRVRDAEDVVDELTEHNGPDGVSALQGGAPRMRTPELLQERWSPASRVLAGAVGGGLLARALSARRPAGVVAGGAGGLLLARAVTNRPLSTWQGPFVVHKSIFIHAGLDDVFALFRKPERFPLFMKHVLEVEKIDDDHYRWKVDGPAGPVTSTLEITRFSPSAAIAWRSVGEGLLNSAGSVHFAAERDGTRVDVELLQHPRLGVMGLALGGLLNRRPKRFLDDDLLRLKSLFENKKATGNAGQVTLEQVTSSA